MFWEYLLAYVPFIRHGPQRKIKKLVGGIYRQIQQGDLISLLLFFEYKGSRLKKGTAYLTNSLRSPQEAAPSRLPLQMQQDAES
jgi:hypothetical protein